MQILMPSDWSGTQSFSFRVAQCRLHKVTQRVPGRAASRTQLFAFPGFWLFPPPLSLPLPGLHVQAPAVGAPRHILQMLIPLLSIRADPSHQGVAAGDREGHWQAPRKPAGRHTCPLCTDPGHRVTGFVSGQQEGACREWWDAVEKDGKKELGGSWRLGCMTWEGAGESQNSRADGESRTATGPPRGVQPPPVLHPE